MKNLKQIVSVIVITILMLGSFSGNAQDNNPYNEYGIKALQSINVVTKDYNDGKIKNLDQSTLDYYSKKLNLVNTTVDFASNIVKRVKSEDLFQYIETLNMTSISKQILINAFSTNSAELLNLVKTINSKKIDKKEKEVLLKTISLIFNYRLNNNKTFTRDPIPCEDAPSLCGAVFGGLIGSVICGPPCGLVGIVIGGIVGSVSK